MKVTLKGSLAYPWLNRPDTKFNDDGEFKTAVIGTQAVNGKLAEAIEAELEKFRNSAETKKKCKGKIPKLHSDALPFDIDEDEGTITFRTKSKCYRNKESGEKWSFAIAFYEKDKTPMGVVKMQDDELVASDTVPNIGAGTKAAVSCEVNCWLVSGKCGVSLRPRALRIVDLVEAAAGGDDFAGDFDDDDDFDAPSVSNTAPDGDDMSDDEDF